MLEKLNIKNKNIDQVSLDTIPYDDPKGFNTIEKMPDVLNTSTGEKQMTKYNEESDIYSAAVLFWELSSGRRPFDDEDYDLLLAMEIAQGHRESIVEGTPEEYSNLYTSE